MFVIFISFVYSFYFYLGFNYFSSLQKSHAFTNNKQYICSSIYSSLIMLVNKNTNVQVH